MPAISVGSVEVDVIPNTQGIYNRLRGALVPAATRAGQDAGNAAGRAFGPAMTSAISDSIGERIGAQIGRQIATRITAAIRGSVGDGLRQGGQAARPVAAKQGEQAGGAFARSIRAKLTEAFRSMPKLDVRLSDTGVDADLARLRARMEALSNKTVGIDIDAATARAQAADIEERLRRIGAAHPNVAVRADTARAIASLQALQAQIDEVTADPARIRVETDGQLGTRLRAAVQQAEASLPNVNIGADTTPAEVEIARLRAKLTELRDARIGVDIDADTALARITEIQARLARLSTQNANVGVRVDAGAAAAQLAAFQAAVNRLDGQTANVNVDTRSAVSGMQVLIATAITFGPAILPVLPVVAAGLGAIAAAATAAGVGIGSIALVAIPAFKQIGSVLQAQKAAQQAATNATYQGGQANSQGASKALQMAGAQQSLATAQRNAARQISDAERGVGDAVRAAAKANSQAAAQVKSARTSLADAYAQASDRMRQANQQVGQAEQDLAQAQKSSRQAQLDLTTARAEASRQLQDMNNQLTDSKLSERDAEIALAEATARRDAVVNNANASDLDKQKTLLAYDQAVQRLNEQRLETKRLAVDTKAANKAGVEGSATVKSAQEQVAAAQQDVIDKTSALKAAQADVTKTQIENTRSIADAQAKLSEAQKNVSETQRQGAENIARAQERVVQAQQSGADSIASAQRQIASASQSAAGGVDQAAIAQAKYEAELAKLTPSARDTYDAFLDLKTVFGDWAKALQPAVMPIFTKAFEGLKNSLPGLTPFVVAAATAIKGLQDRASAGFKSPWWQTFKTDLATSVGPAITGLGLAFGNIFKGMAGIVDAFLPHMDGISSRMQGITQRFANWGANLKGSPEFERFLQFASDKAPILGDALGKIGTAFLNVGEALSPVSGPLLQLLGGAANFIAIIADKAPWFIVLIYGIIVATKLWTLAQAAFNFVMAANPLVLLGLAILALVALVIYAYDQFTWFRTAVDAVWTGLKVGAKAVVDWFTQSFVPFFTDTLPGAFRSALTWVKNNWPWIVGGLGGPMGLAVVWVVKHWDNIKQGIADAWDSIKKNTLSPIKTFFTQTIPGWGTSLKNAIVGSFDAARAGIKTAWDKIKGIAKAPVQYIVDVVYNNGIRGVWNAIAGAFGAPKLDKFTFASGGIMPGYTPGKDVHKFISPTGGQLELSGGEAIMRPEFTRAVGSNFVNALNSIASSRGAQGVKAALAPVFGGSAPISTDRSSRYASGGVVQRFADGGVFGWIKSAGSAIKGAGSDAWNAIKKGASWLADTLEASARAGVEHVVDPLLKRFPGMDTGIGKLVRHIPTKIIDALFGYSKEADKKGGGGLGGPRIQAGLKWARTQDGKPYQWAGNGNPSWDCCIVGPVRVYGPNGATPIQDVQAGDEVYSYVDGKLTAQKVTAAWKSKTQSVFKVRTRNRSVTASANHPFMRLVQTAKSEHVKGGKRGEQIPAKYGIEWARLDELKRGDLLVQPRAMQPEEMAEPALADGSPVTADVAWLLGLFVGDGYLTNNTIRVCVYDDLSVRAQRVFRSLGVNSFTAQKHGVVASSVHLVATLREMGFDRPGAEKRVPDSVWTWPEELRKGFLDGYCDADGHRPKDRTRHGDRTYSSTSRELIEDVRAMHIMLGHPASNISTNNRVKPITIKGKLVKKALPLHSFAVWAGEGRGEGALRRLPGVAEWLDAGDFTLTKVLEVVDEGIQETYDLEVEGAHNFIADGVVVHNSGFMSAIESVIRGQKPHRRWATGAFSGKTAPPGWVYHGDSAFRIGITNAGVGHTAGTLGKTNVESRGGAGVIVGKSARGYKDSLFNSWYGFKPGSYDAGGYLQPGMNLAYNGTGRPEPVFTTAQANALSSMAASGGMSGPMSFEGDLRLDSGEFLGRVRGEATAVMQEGQQQLVQVLNAS